LGVKDLRQAEVNACSITEIETNNTKLEVKRKFSTGGNKTLIGTQQKNSLYKPNNIFFLQSKFTRSETKIDKNNKTSRRY